VFNARHDTLLRAVIPDESRQPAPLKIDGAVISVDPLVTFSKHQPRAPLGLASAVPEAFAGRPSLHLVGLSWAANDHDMAGLQRELAVMRDALPLARFVVLANDTADLLALAASTTPLRPTRRARRDGRRRAPGARAPRSRGRRWPSAAPTAWRRSARSRRRRAPGRRRSRSRGPRRTRTNWRGRSCRRAAAGPAGARLRSSFSDRR